MRLVFITILLCLFQNTHAQQAKQYAFTHFTTANGLPSNIINSIAQDEEGFLWFATINGVSRYDGYQFLNFQTPHRSSFSLTDVAVLFYDKAHNIWVVTGQNKVGIFNPRAFTLKEIDAKALEKKFYSPVTILETPDGTLLLHEFMGRSFRYNEAQNNLVEDSTTIPAPKGWRLSRITWDGAAKRYWMGADSGLALYNPATKQLSYRGHNAEQNPIIEQTKADLNVLYVSVDSSANLLFHNWPPNRTSPFLQSYNSKTGDHVTFNLSEKIGIPYHEIGECLQQRNGRLWVWGHPILAEWLPDRKNFVPVLNEYRTEQSIRFDYIYTLFEDGERNLWAATDNGLYMFNPDAQLFNNYNFNRPGEKELHEYSATSVLQLQDSTVLVSTWGPGLFYFDKSFNPLPLPKALDKATARNRSAWDLVQHTKTGNIWMGMQGGDLVVYNPKKRTAATYTPSIFNNRTIRQVVEDKEGNLWFGTQSGAIIKWNYREAAGNPEVGYSFVYKTGMILKLICDSSGAIWAATFGNGLLRLDATQNKVVQTFTKNAPLARSRLNHDIVSDVLQYNDTLMVAVANGLDLINLNTNTVTHRNPVGGPPYHTALFVEKDQTGMLWLGLANGLCRINLQKGFGTFYDRSNGIAYDNFLTAGAFPLLDGRIALTTDHNFVVFDPKNFSTASSVPPDPDFSSFTLSGVPLSVDSLLTVGKAVLPYDNTSIRITFSVLSFLKQKQPDYYYILDRFDKAWIHGDNEAVYSYLPPGNYTFKVKAINQDGVLSHAYASLDIIVEPPFWRTWWFYGLLALVVVAILYLIDKERQKRRQTLQAMRTQIAGDLHEEINITLNDINLLSEIAKLKADKDLDRSKDYIDQISTKSRTMIESMDDILWSIHPQNDSMQRMLLRLHEFTDGVKKIHALDVELTVDSDVERLTLDMKLRHEFLLFYKDAVVYVIQHSVCDTIYISLEYGKAKLVLKLLAQCSQLDNPGAEAARLEYQMQRHADALNGLLDIMSDRKSISIILQVPV